MITTRHSCSRRTTKERVALVLAANTYQGQWPGPADSVGELGQSTNTTDSVCMGGGGVGVGNVCLKFLYCDYTVLSSRRESGFFP